MTPFLKQVARHFFSIGDIEHTCFILPNRRALTFFKKYLGEEVARSGQAMAAPAMFAMNEFVYELTGARKADRVQQLLMLYDCYKAINPKAEALDDFIFWGGVLLSDFDDVDKYLVEVEPLFTNVSDFKEIQDTYSFLNETQLAAIEQFVGHFRTGSKYKDEFRKIWEVLLPLYKSFNESLDTKGLSYEGKAYRALAERLGEESVSDILSEKFPGSGRFVFVGLNALNKCEKLLMRRMRDAKLAQFCWDYSSDQIRDLKNKSSLFLSENVAEFPQAFDPDPEGLPETCFHVMSVPSSVGQAKQLPEIFRRLDGPIGLNTAVVLPDEGLLIPVLNSIPEELSEINVTMGYPMNGSELWSLMNDIAALQMHLREKDGTWYFYHKQVWAIFSNSVIKAILDEEGARIVSEIRRSARYYIDQESLQGNALLECIFRPMVKDVSVADAQAVDSLARYLQQVLVKVASMLKSHEDMALELDFAKDFYQAIGRLRNHGLAIRPATWFRLLSQIVGNASVPFKGEPLKGLQIMGPLETRALDFDNLVILSCNENIFPRRSVASSFIPAELRRGFELPTYEYQDAVWAYYFYRMIQRAGNVWMLFDSRAEVSRSGEESRYIKQLEMHFGVKTERYVVKSGIDRKEVPDEIPKTEEDVVRMKERRLSASAIQNYLSCPAKFYYHTVLGLSSEDEVSESLDAGMIGNVFHAAMQKIYTVPGNVITENYIRSYTGNPARIKEVVRGLIMEELHTFEVVGRNIIFEDMVCRYVEKALERDLQLLEAYGRKDFRILGLEQQRKVEIGGFGFIGYIDRLDSFDPSEVRVVDYKTGRVTDDDFLIDDSNADSIVESLFGPDNSKRPKIALQLYLYDRFVSDDPEVRGKSVVNSIYQTSRLFVKDIQSVALSPRFSTLMKERLDKLLAELTDTTVPFRRTADCKTCEWCDFKMICGR